MEQWSPIASAPRDSPVLLFCPQEQNPRRRIMIGSFADERRCWIAIPGLYRIRPTMWMKLPPHPEAA
jgi:hypothetical protein